ICRKKLNGRYSAQKRGNPQENPDSEMSGFYGIASYPSLDFLLRHRFVLAVADILTVYQIAAGVVIVPVSVVHHIPRLLYPAVYGEIALHGADDLYCNHVVFKTQRELDGISVIVFKAEIRLIPVYCSVHAPGYIIDNHGMILPLHHFQIRIQQSREYGGGY